jgi:putative ABC transport system substrate-binding protein
MASHLFGSDRSNSGHARRTLKTTLMTLNRHERPNFAVMHNTAFSNDVVGCSPRRQGRPMRRREFITLLGGAAAWVSPARAQERRQVIGVLSGWGSHGFFAEVLMPAFVQGLKDAGFVEGRNISVEIREADGHYDRLPSLAAELVGLDVAAIFAADLPSAFAAKAATKTVPIVFGSGADPVKVGLVDSLSRPKGNLTGISVFISVLGPKRVELLHELLPAANIIALLANPSNVNIKTDEPEIRAAADRLKKHLEVLTASTESEFEAAFATMVQNHVGSLIVMPDPFFISRGEQLVALAARYAMPAIYPNRSFADLGGLMSYGSNIPDLNKQAGIYIGKILRGAKPADLPIQQSTKIELVINLKTANALGLKIPVLLLAQADEVIE